MLSECFFLIGQFRYLWALQAIWRDRFHGRAREERLGFAVERVADAILPPEGVPAEYRQAVGAETESATRENTTGCANKEWWRRRDSNP